ncbi:MAG: rhodanese-like domain-containing protein [Bacteroidota bacterium]
MGILKTLLGGRNSAIAQYLEKGAIVIDVRTPQEYAGGHVPGSKNIPLQTLPTSVKQIKKLHQPVIVCCASGVRSGQATAILREAGIDCINGGPWTKVNQKVEA